MGEKKYLVDSEGLARLVINIKAMLGQKVDVETGKGLSTEDFTTALKTKLESLENYTLPIASTQTLGGVKVGTGLSINASGELSATGEVMPADIEVMSIADIDALFEEENQGE